MKKRLKYVFHVNRLDPIPPTWHAGQHLLLSRKAIRNIRFHMPPNDMIVEPHARNEASRA